ncbi:hypothetical protein CAAN1_05S04192 [[Candida] anglica]|uniref:Glycogenin glucosyltransferase n=1 Tax=[Candida] anglica TaxID=148631 RepID=A0ABP0EEQ7_9ASCO
MTIGVVTLLYDPSYLPGALVLGVSLLKLVSSSSLDIETAILIDESKFTKYQLELLLELYDVLIPVQTFSSSLHEKLVNDLQRPELAKTFTKVALWGLSRYSKILYLDADTLPEWNQDHTILDLLKLSFPQNKVLAVPDSGFPDIFNSGVFVLQPNARDYENLLILVEESLHNPDVSFDGADQGLLNQYFNPQPNWVVDLLENDQGLPNDIGNIESTQTTNWIKIPFVYNVTPSSEYEYLPAYKYFTNSTNDKGGALPTIGSTSPVDLKNLGVDSIDNNSLEVSTKNTLNRYSSSAKKYFRKGNQIKLMHFIGPIKPWHSEKAIVLQHESHVHKKWWNLWAEYYGTASSVESVVFWEKALGSDSNAHEMYFTKGQESGMRRQKPVVNKVEDDLELENEPPKVSATDPNALCDPRSYVNTNISTTSSSDSTWDPTKEPPPKSSGHEISTFGEGVTTFENTWDKSQDQILESRQVEEVQDLPENNEDNRSNYEPERVFNDVEGIIESSPTSQSDQLAAKLRELVMESEQELEDNYEVEAVTHEQKEQSLEPVHNYGKLFPWEYREEVHAPERTFE